MLVLRRKKDQALMIGEVEIRVVEIRGNRVALAINAPPDVLINREEIYRRIVHEREASSKAEELANP